MSFASPLFLWYFLPAVLLTYWALPGRFRNALVSVASLGLYAFGGGSFVLALIGVMVVNFAAGIAMDSEAMAARPGRRRALLIAIVTADLAVLAVWKYAGFAAAQIDAVSSALGGPAVPAVQLALPIGISFFTFHHISYVVDVYRHSRHAQRSPVQFATYIAMFPQLVAGPIVRYHEIDAQLADTDRDRLDDFAAGFPRFALGLTKKVVIADALAPVADAVFALPEDQLTTTVVWIGVLAYTLQIYFDFSGYSDMAIGLGQMLGFRLPENFARPYSAVSMTDFWRRWHMSLSRWFRDYVYIPLGGNRSSGLRTYGNLFTVFLLTGFWHGAAWTFLVWGLFHGLLLAIERATGLARVPDDVWRVPRRALTFLLVVIGWVFFRAADMGRALDMLEVMLVLRSGPVPSEVATLLTTQVTLVFAVGLLVVLLPRDFVMGKVVDSSRTRLAGTARLAYSAIGAPYAAVVVAAGTFSPFLYFQF
ncbi:MAG: MBOAT family protein [Frankiaceae bacterium]|nr:MBOAT family protein [Frankiaceae bacterium]